MGTDGPNSSSSSWFKQRAYNGGTMIDHRYEYCYYFVLHYDESASKVTLVPMIRNGLFTSGKYKTAKVGPRYRYQCNVLDTNRNWMIDVPASSLLPATSSQVQASSYLDDDTINDDSRRYSKRRSQLLVSIDKSKLCKQKMKSYPRSRIHYYNKIVFRKRSSILNSIIMDNDNNNSSTTDGPNSSSSSWFKQRAYNGGT